MVKSLKSLFLILGFITACMPIMVERPLVISVSMVSDQLIVTGQGFINIEGLTLSNPNTGFKKTFKVASVSGSQIVGTAVDSKKVAVPSLMDLIIDTAQGQSTYPVSFSLQNNAVTNPTINNGAISPEKFKGVATSNPPHNTVLTWSQPTQSFMFTTVSGGVGSSGVTEIVLGTGITGDPNIASGSVPISVDIGQTGDASKTKIPYFSSSNKIVLDSTFSPSVALSGLSFLDGGKNFDIYNDNSLRIDGNATTDLLVLDVDGTLNLKGPVTVGGVEVCLSNGNCTSVSGISVVTATPPLAAAQVATGTINISAGAVNTASNLVQLDGSGKLPAVDGSLVTNIPTMASATAPYQIIISSGAGKQLTTTVYPIPVAIGASGTVLKSDGTSAVWQAETTGTGDVAGPATATLNSIARYESGKVIKESGIIIDDANNISGVAQLNTKVANNLVTGTGIGVGRNLPMYVGLSPTEIEDSGISLDNIATMSSNATAGFQPILSGGSNKSQIAAPYTLPNTTCLAGEVLKWNATGFTCQADFGGSGDMAGPATSVLNTLAQFSDSTGKIIKGTAWAVPNTIGGLNQYLSVVGAQDLAWTSLPDSLVNVGGAPVNFDNIPYFSSSSGTQLLDSGLPYKNVLTQTVASAAANHIKLSQGTNKIVVDSGYTVPLSVCLNGQILKSDGTNFTCQADEAGTGDVAGPASSTDLNLVVFSGTNGKVILDPGINLADLPVMATNAGDLYRPILSADANKKLMAASYSLPTIDGSPGQILQTNGSGIVAWVNIPVSAALEYPYQFETVISDADPGNGKVQINDANPFAATFIYVADEDGNLFTVNRRARFLLLKPGDLVDITSTSDPNNDYLYDVTGNPIADTGYVKIPVTSKTISGTIADAQRVTVALVLKSGGSATTTSNLADTSNILLTPSGFVPPTSAGVPGQVLISNGIGSPSGWKNSSNFGTSASMPSDIKLKKEIKDLTEGYVDKIMDLRPVAFVWRDNFNPDIGFIAQEVFKVFPDLVENNDDVLGINYSKLVVPLVKAFQEQNIKIQKDEQTIKMLLERVDRLEKIIGQERKK